jgi:hypothetical protein
MRSIATGAVIACAMAAIAFWSARSTGSQILPETIASISIEDITLAHLDNLPVTQVEDQTLVFTATVPEVARATGSTVGR